MHSAFRLIGFGLVGAVLAGCDGGGSPDAQHATAAAGRLDAIEKRLAAVEKTAEPIEQLRNESASLDRRLSSLETTVRELAARPAATGSAPPPTAPMPAAPAHRPPTRGPGAWGPTTRPDRTERRAELRALSDEFRSRLAELRAQPGGGDADKTREILDWYREQRRLILRGESRTD